MLDTPVAFLIFNRPETTRLVFNAISQVKPKKLLLVSDGPRHDRQGEHEKCNEVRAIVEQVNWDCVVIKNYASSNLGCKQRIATGLNWVFEQCQEAIILEDDCLPNTSFFTFCSELLAKYRTDDRVMAISGNNFQFGKKRGPYSYYFSRYSHIWGWASWRRAWKHYDVNMTSWPELRNSEWLINFLKSKAAAKYWQELFNKGYDNKIDTWDLQWIFSCWRQQGLTIIPNRNLVANIGFGEDATHTKEDVYNVADLPTEAMKYPLLHPSLVEVNERADNYTFKRVFAREIYKPAVWRRGLKKLLSLLPSDLQEQLYSFYRKQ